MVVFTSICANYLHKARVLARSVKKYIPDAVFIVCMTERGLTDSMRDDAFDSVVLSKDMWEGDFDAYILARHCRGLHGCKGAVFPLAVPRISSGTAVCISGPGLPRIFRFFRAAGTSCDKAHRCMPHLVNRGNVQMEISSLAHGVYNLGFLAVNRSKEARAMAATSYGTYDQKTNR